MDTFLLSVSAHQSENEIKAPTLGICIP